MLERKDKELNKMTSEYENMKILLKSYESQNLKITQLEVKLRSQHMRYEKELKDMMRKYEEKNTKNSQEEKKPNITLNKTLKRNSFIEEEEICQENVICYLYSIIELRKVLEITQLLLLIDKWKIVM
jgi:hypothetical protein